MQPIEIQHLAYKEAGCDYVTSRPHRHAGYQWYAVIYGRVIAALDGRDHQLGPGDSVLIAPETTRAPRYGGQSPGYLYVVFNNRTLRLRPLVGRVVHMPEGLVPDLHALVTELHRSPGANASELIEALVVRLLIGLSRNAAGLVPAVARQPSTLNASYHQELATRAESFMRSNLHRRLAREEIAAAVHVSAPHLARIFRATVGKSVVQRLTELRLAQARHLLLESSIPITQIASDVGYESFSHFSAIFKSSVGIRPSDYRRATGNTWVKI
jgi:AraC-like DNA-binding protein